MKKWLKTLLLSLAKRLWLRPNTQRRSIIGPYRGLTFSLTHLMLKRLDVFYRAYESNVTHWLAKTVRPGMTVYVVGAHIGVHVLYILKLLETAGTIYAFEGWPENYQFLQENLALNVRPGVQVIPVQQCVAQTSGTVLMAAGSSDGKNHLTGQATTSSLEVQATSLDDFYSQHNHCPDIILIDIEGYELDALNGALHLLHTCKPRLVLEHHDKAAALQDWLIQRGYTIDTADKRHIFAS